MHYFQRLVIAASLFVICFAAGAGQPNSQPHEAVTKQLGVASNCSSAMRFLAQDWIGRQSRQVTDSANRTGLPWRITRHDAENFAVTMDHSPNRFNFEFDNDRLTSVTCG